MKTNILSLLAFVAIVFFQSCKKEKPQPTNPGSGTTPTNGSVVLHFESVAGSIALQLDTTICINQNGDTFKVSKFDYYISNIKLVNTSGGYFTETESYHLIKTSDLESQELLLSNVPVGNYNQLIFTIGVDSARNVSGAQTGALDPAEGMFWSWSSGYIMAKVEGTSTQSPSGNIQFHIGGFSGSNTAVKTITLPFPINLNITGTGVPEVHLMADVLEWFQTPTTIAFGTTSTVTMAGAMAGTIANNYTDMVHVDHIHQ